MDKTEIIIIGTPTLIKNIFYNLTCDINSTLIKPSNT